MTIDEIIENFSFLDDWDDRYRYVIELAAARALPDAGAASAAGAGCASRVWSTRVTRRRHPTLSFVGDSDAPSCAG
jgi:cysteine desulfuration protein SufE